MPRVRPATPRAEGRLVVGHRLARSRRVQGVGARDGLEQERRVANVLGERADLIEGRREGDEPVARDSAVGRLESDHAAEGGGLPHGPAGVGAETAGGEVGGDRGRGAARGAAGHAVEPPRVAGHAEAGVLRRGAHRELVAVRLAEEDGAVAREAHHRGGVVGRHEVPEDARPAGRADSTSTEHVLDRQRHAIEGSRRIAPAEPLVHRIGLGPRQIGRDRQVGSQRAVEQGDAREVGLDEGACRDAAGPERLDGLVDGEAGPVAQGVIPPGSWVPGTARRPDRERSPAWHRRGRRAAPRRRA